MPGNTMIISCVQRQITVTVIFIKMCPITTRRETVIRRKKTIRFSKKSVTVTAKKKNSESR